MCFACNCVGVCCEWRKAIVGESGRAAWKFKCEEEKTSESLFSVSLLAVWLAGFLGAWSSPGVFFRCKWQCMNSGKVQTVELTNCSKRCQQCRIPRLLLKLNGQSTWKKQSPIILRTLLQWKVEGKSWRRFYITGIGRFCNLFSFFSFFFFCCWPFFILVSCDMLFFSCTLFWIGSSTCSV